MTEPESCHFHDLDLGPCIKVKHDDSSPHICSRKKLIGLEEFNIHQSPIGEWKHIFQRGETYYVTASLDGFITKNTCLAWCSSQNAPLGSILTGHYACDCKGPLRRLTGEQRRTLRAWAVADNALERLICLHLESGYRSGLVQRWTRRLCQLEAQLDLEPLHYLTLEEDHGVTERGDAVQWSRWVTRTKDEA